MYLRHHVILRHVIVRHIIVLWCHVGDIHVFVSSCKCYSRLVNVCHGFVPSCFCYFCHSNVFHAHACHAIVCHAIVTSCKCLSCKRDHVNERHTSASSRVPRWLRLRRTYYTVHTGLQILWSIHKRLALEITILIITITIVIIKCWWLSISSSYKYHQR